MLRLLSIIATLAKLVKTTLQLKLIFLNYILLSFMPKKIKCVFFFLLYFKQGIQQSLSKTLQNIYSEIFLFFVENTLFIIQKCMQTSFLYFNQFCKNHSVRKYDVNLSNLENTHAELNHIIKTFLYQ